MGEFDVKIGLKNVLQRIEEVCSKKGEGENVKKPLLVAVSKTKPVEMIVDAYSEGQRHFGENYVQELVEKGSNPLILEKCPDIKWHFIGHLQSNKINKVLKVPNLHMVQTVDSEKLANGLDSAWSRLEKSKDGPLEVLVQINTSGEDEKSGVEPEHASALYKHIKEDLPNLKVKGIMTIGKFGHDYSTGPNPDFIALMKCHEQICKEQNLNSNEVDVSMGMSDDFDKAIEVGSTIVRVGSSIFGYRPKKHEVQ
uniref:Pyridoxal phosphate homeostasis protein n=1 Tax=Tabanus bromius TaxID=304241 RepID=A0A0K8TTC5_TABBR